MRYIILLCMGVWISCNLERIELDSNSSGSKFTTKLGGGKNDFPRDLLVTRGGSYIIVGETNSFGAGDKQSYIVKISDNGKFLKEKAYGGSNNDVAHAVYETADGGFIYCGTFGQINSNNDLYIVRTNSELDTVWTRVFGSVDSIETGLGIAPLNDTSFVVGYTLAKKGAASTFITVVRYGLSGKRLGANRVREGVFYMSRMFKTSDNKLVFVGSESSGGTYSYILKCNEDGSYLWEKKFPNSNPNFVPAYSVAEMSNGDLVIAGSMLGNNDHDHNLVGYNQIGGELWNSSWGGANADELWAISKTNDNEIVVAGYTGSFSGTNEVYLSKRRLSDRIMIWEQHFESISVFLLDLEPTKDGGFIIAAPQQEQTGGNADILIFKTDSEGKYK